MIGESIYVLLRGTVKYTKGTRIKHINIGHGFGKVHLSSMHSKYHYEAEEDSEILTISYNAIRECVLRPVKEEFLERVTALRAVKYIKELNPYAAVLFTLAGSIKIYRYGNVIIRQHIHPEAFCIIIEGQCKSVYDQVLTRIEELRATEMKESYFKFGLNGFNNVEKEESEELLNTSMKELKRSFDNEQVKVVKAKGQPLHKKVSYRTHVTYLKYY